MSDRPVPQPGILEIAPYVPGKSQAAPGVTAIKLIRDGYEIKAGWPGGLWLQKKLDTFFCNTGRQLDGETLCWTLNDPVKGGVCQ